MGINFAITNINSSQTTDNGWDVYLVDCTNNDITLSLNSAFDGKPYFIKRFDTNTSNTLTVAATGGDMIVIDGNSSASVTVNTGATLKLMKFGSNWINFL